MTKALILVAPGFIKKSGYYYRVIRDREALENIGCDVEIFDPVNEIKKTSLLNMIKTFTTLYDKADMVFYENVSVILFHYLAGIARLKKVKSVFVCHGSLEDLEAYSFYKIKKAVYQFFERKAALSFQYIITVSDVMADYFKLKYKDLEANLVTMPNIPNTNFITAAAKAKAANKLELRIGLNIPTDKVVITYCGNAQLWQKCDFFISICEALFLKKPDKYFFQVLTTETEVFNRLFNETKIRQCAFNIKQVANEAVPSYLVCSDFLYAIRDENEINRVSCPTKLIEYLYSGSPIIMSNGIGDISDFVKSNKLGVVVDSDATTESIYGDIDSFKPKSLDNIEMDVVEKYNFNKNQKKYRKILKT